MYGVGQSSPQRRGFIVIIGVAVLVLLVGGVFFAFYTLVLKKDTTATIPEASATVAQLASPTESASLPPSPPPTDTATARPATATKKPTAHPSDTPKPSPTLPPPPGVITVSVRARVNISEGLAINLRDLPTLSGSVIITQLLAGAEVDVIDGPEDVGDLRWWNVDGGEGRMGWVVEAYGSETWLSPVDWSDQLPPLSEPSPTATATATPTLTPTVATPTATATPEVTPTLAATPVLTPTVTSEGGIPSPTVGGRARVTTQYQFINLRAEPGLGAESVGQLADGTMVTILEGPEESDGFHWWKVDDSQENVGWAAERVGGEVLLVPVP